MLTLFIFWICLIATENDPPEVFMDEYKEKKLTQLPLYSLYKLNNETFFTKTSKYIHLYVNFSWNILVLSILWG
jgi:hypothetical protein